MYESCEGKGVLMTELQCPACHNWYPENEWEKTEVDCEDCGSHEALRCPNLVCDEVFDTIYTHLEERGL